MPSFITIPLLFVFPALMAFAAFSDLFTMRITNKLVLVVVVAFLAIALLAGLPLEQIGMHVLVAVVVLLVAFSFFAFGWIGGGDAKLIAATTLWFGLSNMLPYLLYASLLGGSLTLALLAVRRFPLPPQLKTVVWIDRLHDAKTGVPYGLALAAAAVLVYPTSTIFQRLLG
ncbi:MAG: prepilin peptidase [Devosia sp.]|uniref:A24 family peptidase n=1 Tax=Devosia sp. TaxID=1871048 RepID=UPI001AC96E6B|nr:prepilin peptidase [Devosia sp.]MBN9314888.1 prepilin peptidase [Devosia sp.]